MFDKFEEMDKEKKQKIIDAAINEFAQKGYDKASTNKIVEAAGISKGLLFHYFKSKKNLFIYVAGYATDVMINKLREFMDSYSCEDGEDIFTTLMQKAQAKMRLAVEEPVLYRMMFSAFITAPDDIKAAVNKKYAQYFIDERQSVIDLVDTSKLREGVDPFKVIEMIYMVVNGVFGRYEERYKKMTPEEAIADINNIQSHMEDYFDLLRKGVYKSEA